MAAKLTSLIPAQNFELIRERIAVILAEELAHQYTLHNIAALNPGVWIERVVPYDKTELPAVAVSLSKGDYDNKDARKADGTYTYYVDCYAAAPSSSGEDGDYKANVLLQRLLGMCRAILENPVYRTLDFAPPSISRVAVTGFTIGDTDSSGDAISKVQGRIDFVVRVPETVELITAVPITGNDTTVKLVETDKGYKYVLNL